MKKIGLLLVLLSLVVTGSLFAQTSATKFGVIAGVSLTDFIGDDVGGMHGGDHEITPNITIGFKGVENLSPLLSVGCDVVLTVKGSTYNQPTKKSIIKLSYLEMPIYGIVKVTKRLNLQLGGYLGILLSSRLQEEIFGGPNTSYILTGTNFYDAGLMGGISFEVFNNFLLETRYSLGTVSIHDVYDIKNTNIQVLATYMFN